MIDLSISAIGFIGGSAFPCIEGHDFYTCPYGQGNQKQRRNWDFLEEWWIKQPICVNSLVSSFFSYLDIIFLYR